MTDDAPVSVGLGLRELLRDPPWLAKVSLPLVLEGADRIEMNLATLPVPTWWAPHDRERRVGYARFIPQVARGTWGMSAPELEHAIATFDPAGPLGRIPLIHLCALSDDDATRIFNEAPTTVLQAEPFALEAIVARLGPRVAKGLARRGADLGLRTTVLELLAHVGTPLAVPTLLDAFFRLPSLRGLAKRAMLRFRETMLEALVPLAVGTTAESLGLEPIQKPAELVRAARLALHFVSGAGGFDAITSAAARLGVKDAWFAIRREDPLRGAKAPSIAPAFALAVVKAKWIGGDAFTREERERFVTWLAMLDWETPRLATIRTDVDPASLDAIARALWDAWLEQGPSRVNVWTAHAALELGSRETVHHMKDTLREWRATYQTPAVEVLRAAGSVAIRHFDDPTSSAALELLGEIAIEGSSRAQEAHARNVIQWVDEELDEVDDLDDRLVPTLGLEHGSLRLDYGPRTFTVTLDTSLALHLKDDTGATIPKLPSPRKSDDAEKAKASKARISALARDARILVARLQTRMQSALAAQKRWSADAFFGLLAEHPVVGCFVRGLVWMAFDASDAPHASFRLCEDGSLAGVDDRVFTLPKDHGVRLLHPAMIDAGACAAWARALADYEVIQPFSQLGWPMVRLDEAERASTSIVRTMTVSTSTLAERGWLRGPFSLKDTAHTTYEKQTQGGLRIIVFHEPVAREPPSHVTTRELRAQRLETTGDAFLRWSAVDAVSASEALHDLDAATSTP